MEEAALMPGTNRLAVDKAAAYTARQEPSVVDSGRQKAGQLASTSGRPRQDDLPYTIAAPGSYEEFARLVEGRPALELSLAVQRIRACNAVALGSENRRKLQVCFSHRIRTMT